MKISIRNKSESFSFETDLEVITIGRSSDNDFVIPVDDFSRKHCQLSLKGNYIFITDLGSKNGVTIDGKRLPPNEPTPIYKNSHVVLANSFSLFLPNTNLDIKSATQGFELKLEDARKRSR